MPAKVKVLNASIERCPEGGDGISVIRGSLDPAGLRFLKTPEYQREVLNERTIASLMYGLRHGRPPSVELGMRGDKHEDAGDGVIICLADLWIIDGLQRVTAGMRVMADTDAPCVPWIGADINFPTTEAWERRRFDILNLSRTKLSPNIHLRNMRADFPAVEALWRLAHDTGFALCQRVTWTQAPKKRELVTATIYVKAAGRLHAHLAPASGTNVGEVAAGVNRVADNVGTKQFVANVRNFWELLDECWGIRNIDIARSAVVVRGTFVSTMASVLSDHVDFWGNNDRALAVPVPIVTKFKQVKLSDPTVSGWSSGNGSAGDFLYDYIVGKLNSGRRTKLVRRGRARTLISHQEAE